MQGKEKLLDAYWKRHKREGCRLCLYSWPQYTTRPGTSYKAWSNWVNQANLALDWQWPHHNRWLLQFWIKHVKEKSFTDLVHPQSLWQGHLYSSWSEHNKHLCVWVLCVFIQIIVRGSRERRWRWSKLWLQDELLRSGWKCGDGCLQCPTNKALGNWAGEEENGPTTGPHSRLRQHLFCCPNCQPEQLHCSQNWGWKQLKAKQRLSRRRGGVGCLVR